MTVITSTKPLLMMTINILISIVLTATSLTAVDAQTLAAPTTTLISNSNTTNTTSSAIDLSQQPVLQERTRIDSETPIDYAYMSITFAGNGTLTLPNNNINNKVNFTSNGSALISFITQSSQGTEILRTNDGTTATLTFYEIAKFNPVTGEGEGIIIAEVSTNPSGPLAPLNGMILAGIDDIRPNGESNVTLWEWESRISNLALLPI
ncbi:MAG TPA: hypothetical protein VFY68_14430 [Nitrososphaeraceae archaeon]|jgi:hypothetical protein|nr:hypothetical protein [Nitrososphaeraceae archaeon]